MRTSLPMQHSMMELVTSMTPVSRVAIFQDMRRTKTVETSSRGAHNLASSSDIPSFERLTPSKGSTVPTTGWALTIVFRLV